MLPVFQSVYGGYYLAAGAEFFANDFAPNPDVFASKVAKQLLYGAQMGWFSLGGRDNQSPYMGIYSQLVDTAHDAEIDYLQRLSFAKIRAREWLTHGRMMRDLSLVVNGTKVAPPSPLSFDAVSSAVWRSPSSDSLLVVITTVERYRPAFDLEFSIDMRDYGYAFSEQTPLFQLSQLTSDGERVIGQPLNGSNVHYKGVLAAREVLLLKVAKASRVKIH